VASHPLIDDYLADLARRLPGDAVDELADGLIETYDSHRTHGLEPATAARRAIGDFGDRREVVDAFVRQSPGRRTALLLLACGPVAGAAWGTALITNRAWTWIPVPTRVAFGVGLAAVVIALATAATSRHRYRRTRRAAAGGAAGLLVLDATVLAGVLLAAPTFSATLAAAVAVSLARLAVTLRALPRIAAG
jgi:hypothetical protein